MHTPYCMQHVHEQPPQQAREDSAGQRKIDRQYPRTASGKVGQFFFC